MRSSVAAVLAIAALAAPAAARARPAPARPSPRSDSWIEAYGGAFLPQHRDLDGVDPGIAAGIALGAWLTRYLGLEGGFGYARATGTENGTTLTASEFPFTANLRLRAPLRRIELSVWAGAALHVASLSAKTPAALGGTTRTSDTAMAFGGQVGAGAGLHLSPALLLGAAVDRSFVNPRFAGTAVRFDALRAVVTLTYQL